MAAVRRICAGGIQPVRVVYGDGQVLQLAPMVKVADVLNQHPHHYICHVSPDLPSNRSSMLPLDTELEPGYVYFLLPLPRLFPTAGNTHNGTCSCYYLNHERDQDGGNSNQSMYIKGGGFSPLIIKQMISKFGSPMRTPKKKVSPEFSRQPSNTQMVSSNPYSPNFGKENNPLLSPTYKKRASPKKASKSSKKDNTERDVRLSQRWRPRLGCISETDAFVAAFEELRLNLDRRRMTFESRGRPSSPLRGPEYCRSPSGEPTKSTTNQSYTAPKQHMPLSGYLFV